MAHYDLISFSGNNLVKKKNPTIYTVNFFLKCLVCTCLLLYFGSRAKVKAANILH